MQEIRAIRRPCRKFEGHTRRVNGVIHLPGGQRIITCSNDGSLRLWNLESGEQIGGDWRDKGSAVYDIALSPDGKKVVSGSEDGEVRLWDIDTSKLVAKWTGHRRGVSSVCWNRDGRRVVSGGSHDGTARVWDVESGQTIVGPIETGLTLVEAVIYSPDSTLIGTGGDNEESQETEFVNLKIWDSNTGGLVTNLKLGGHTDSGVSCLAWIANRTTLISGSFHGSTGTWDTTTWKQTSAFSGHPGGSVTGLAVSPNGHVLASASYDGTVRLWSLENGQSFSSPLLHDSEAVAGPPPVICVSFSRDGGLLATGCLDHNVYIWDISSTVGEPDLDNLPPNPDPHVTRRPIHRLEDSNRLPGSFDNSSDHPQPSGTPSSTARQRAVRSSRGRILLNRFFSTFRQFA